MYDHFKVYGYGRIPKEPPGEGEFGPRNDALFPDGMREFELEMFELDNACTQDLTTAGTISL